MPYVATHRRAELDRGEPPAVAGELNYVLTLMLKHGEGSPRLYAEVMMDYISLHGRSYQTYNDVIGAATGALMEARRRGKALSGSASGLYRGLGNVYEDEVGPYEDLKIQENGDVWE